MKRCHIWTTSIATSQRTRRFMVDKITRRSQQIGAFPQSGREVPEYQEQDIREVLEAPYRIVYRIKSEDQVDVLAVFHGAQRLPDDIDT